MNMTIIAVGRLKKSPELELMRRYIMRCHWNIKVVEVEEKKPLKGAERMSKEGELLLKAIPDGAMVIALDEKGPQMRSIEFAKKLQSWQDQAVHNLIFLIGGAEGYDHKVTKRADSLLSFGKMTWPHMMIRAMLCEQLYRASTILQGHPYHKD